MYLIEVNVSLCPSGVASESYGMVCVGYSRIAEDKKAPTQNCFTYTTVLQETPIYFLLHPFPIIS